MDCIPTVVASEKKLQRQVPQRSEMVKVGVPSVNFKNLTNTVYMTPKSISGFSTDQAIPRNDP